MGGFGITGLYGVQPEGPDFAAVTPASGPVTFRRLETGEPGGPPGTRKVGLLLAQLRDPRRLRIEVMADARATAASFSDAATIYVR